MSAVNLNSHGYTFTLNNNTFYVIHNNKLDSGTLNGIHGYLPNWMPNPKNGFMTICVYNNTNVIGIYQVERVINLFAICPKYLNDISYTDAHMLGILSFIHELIKTKLNVSLANKVGYKIAFYKPNEVNLDFNSWPGVWNRTKSTSQTICDTLLPKALDEHIVKWEFDDNYNIVKASIPEFTPPQPFGASGSGGSGGGSSSSSGFTPPQPFGNVSSGSGGFTLPQPFGNVSSGGSGNIGFSPFKFPTPQFQTRQ